MGYYVFPITQHNRSDSDITTSEGRKEERNGDYKSYMGHRESIDGKVVNILTPY